MSSIFIAQLAIRDLTSRVPKDQGSEVTTRLDQSIADEIDFVCGTVPHVHGPVPGPSPYPFAVAAELNVLGNIMQEGSLRNSIMQLAGQIVNRAVVPVVTKRETRVAA
jgi:hypothetical protein